jgi:hypothetical protein
MPADETRSPPAEDLPYRIELWRDGDGSSIERVVARAASAQLAHAIFRAVRDEHPDRRITLREGERIVADSAQGVMP